VSKIVSEIKLNCEKLTKDYEIIFIDDGSSDDTWSSIKNQTLNENRIVGIKLSRNFGHHYAITAGINSSKGDWVVVMDGDLQDRPEVIPRLYRKAQEGFEIVFVSRQNRPENIIYRYAQKFYYVVLRYLSGISFDSSEANFSILSRKAVEAYKRFPESVKFYGSTVKLLGFSRTSISADHGSRYSGKPSYTLKKRFNLAFDIILAFSNKPLKIAINVGLSMATISLFFACWIFYRAFKYGFDVIGWASLMTTIIFSTGTILTVLGIFGVYLGRVYNEVKSRPLYIIQDSINLT
jgi:dolichol-phosphate mannosyltransferase